MTARRPSSTWRSGSSAQRRRDAAALRLVPALAGIALIPLLAALARRVAGDAAGLWAAAFTAVLPATLLVSLNARMYAPAGTLVVAAALLGWRAVEAGRAGRGRWAAYAAVAAAAVWTDYFAAPALAGRAGGDGLPCAAPSDPRGRRPRHRRRHRHDRSLAADCPRAVRPRGAGILDAAAEPRVGGRHAGSAVRRPADRSGRPRPRDPAGSAGRGDRSRLRGAAGRCLRRPPHAPRRPRPPRGAVPPGRLWWRRPAGRGQRLAPVPGSALRRRHVAAAPSPWQAWAWRPSRAARRPCS